MLDQFNISKNKFQHLSLPERRIIEKLARQGITKSEIANMLGRHRSTITRQLNNLKNTDWVRLGAKVKRMFVASKSHTNYQNNKSSCGAKFKIFRDLEFVKYLENAVINLKWSPEVAIARAKLLNMQFKTSVTAKTVYNYIDRNQLKINYFHLRFKLRRKKAKKRYIKQHKKRLGRSIEERPFNTERTEFGHFEADCICDKYNNAILVIQERLTRFGFMLTLDKHDSENSFKQLKTLRRKHPKMFKSITCDNGSEFYKYPEIETENLKVYFTHPYCSYEKGGIENLNGIIRRYIPKGKDLKSITRQKLQSICYHINNIPRKILNFRTPYEMFEAYSNSIA